MTTQGLNASFFRSTASNMQGENFRTTHERHISYFVFFLGKIGLEIEKNDEFNATQYKRTILKDDSVWWC